MNIVKSTIFKKTVLILFLAGFIGAFIMPSFGVTGPFTARTNEVNHLLYVIEENGTGLEVPEEAKLAEVILSESSAYNLDPLFILAMIKTESDFYNWSRSLSGAMGLMQILPSTGKELAGKLKLKWSGEETLLDPLVNVKMGIHYFSWLKGRFSDTEITLAAYNEGPGHVNFRRSLGRDADTEFADKVFNNYKDLKERANYY